MHKRSPAIVNPNSPKAFWNPKNIPNVPLTLMRMAGFDDSGILFPEMESYNISLQFDLEAGQSKTESISSKNGTWILLERMATIKDNSSRTYAPPPVRDQVIVNSYIISDTSNTNITLIEDQPVSLVFGTGEWQHGLFPQTWTSVNNRVFTVKNLSPYPVSVSLGFKLSRVAPAVIY